MWIHQHGVSKFAWQEGYAAFTVSPSQLSNVHRYIANQVDHHRDETFKGVSGVAPLERSRFRRQVFVVRTPAPLRGANPIAIFVPGVALVSLA